MQPITGAPFTLTRAHNLLNIQSDIEDYSHANRKFLGEMVGIVVDGSSCKTSVYFELRH